MQRLFHMLDFGQNEVSSNTLIKGRERTMISLESFETAFTLYLCASILKMSRSTLSFVLVIISTFILPALRMAAPEHSGYILLLHWFMASV